MQDVTKLLAFQFMQADGLCPAPDFGIFCGRLGCLRRACRWFSAGHFGERISQRYALGPLDAAGRTIGNIRLQQAATAR